LQRWKTRKKRSRQKRTEPDNAVKPSAWDELDRQDALAFWAKTNGMK